ncbi:MAG: branched-chain-amino-acid transaminase [Elusimicrobiota bacterium]
MSVFDHGLLYGDGVFEGIRCYGGKIFKLREHTIRLYNSAKAVYINVPYAQNELERFLLESIRINNIKDGYIRLVVTRGYGDLGLDPRKCPKATVIIIADQIALFPEEVYDKGIRLITSSLRRTPHDTLSPSIKSLNYLNNILARAESIRADAQEAILLNHQGYVTECSGDNIFCIKAGVVMTPPIHAGILPGITRATVIELLRTKMKTTVSETMLTLTDLYSSEEVFLTGTGAEIIGVVEIDRQRIGDGKPGRLTRQIEDAYNQLTQISGANAYDKNPCVA